MELIYQHPWWTTLWLFLICCAFSDISNIRIRKGGNDT